VGRKLKIAALILLLISSLGYEEARAQFGAGAGVSVYTLDLSEFKNVVLPTIPELLQYQVMIPDFLVVPLLQLRLQLGLPLGIVNALRMEVSALSIKESIELNEGEGVLIDLDTYFFSVSTLRRFNLFLLGVYFGLGADLINGSLSLSSQAFQNIIDHWRAATLHGLGGFWIGLPFLQIYGEGKFLVPLSQDKGNLKLSVGNFQISVGLMVLI
jgi:hypothetical protein